MLRSSNPDFFHYSKRSAKAQSQPYGAFRTAVICPFDQCLSPFCRFKSASSAFISAISTFSLSSHSSRVCAYTFLACFLPSIHVGEYRYGEEYLEQLLRYLEGNIRHLDEYLRANMPRIRLIQPEGTFLMWLDCRELGLSDAELDQFFTHRAEVALDKGVWFGKPEGSGFMRMNIACPRSTLKTALGRIGAIYRTL